MKVSNVILGTGCYDLVKSGNTLSVTGDGGNFWGYFGNSYKKLAPRLFTYQEYINGLSSISSLDKDLYLKKQEEIIDRYIESYYDTRLKDLDVDLLIDHFSKKFGNNIILLCHESPNLFCHRRLIADYIELKKGEYIPEVSVSSDGDISFIKPIDYKDKLIKCMKKRM